MQSTMSRWSSQLENCDVLCKAFQNVYIVEFLRERLYKLLVRVGHLVYLVHSIFWPILINQPILSFNYVVQHLVPISRTYSWWSRLSLWSSSRSSMRILTPVRVQLSTSLETYKTQRFSHFFIIRTIITAMINIHLIGNSKTTCVFINQIIKSYLKVYGCIVLNVCFLVARASP